MPTPAPQLPERIAASAPAQERPLSPQAIANETPPPAPHVGAMPPEALVEERASSEITKIVAHLLSVAPELLRDGRGSGVTGEFARLKASAVDYDLDDLMSITDGELKNDVIAYFQDVARTVLELEKLARDTAHIRSLDNGAELLERARIALRVAIVDEIARGTRMAEGLRRQAAGSTARSG